MPCAVYQVVEVLRNKVSHALFIALEFDLCVCVCVCVCVLFIYVNIINIKKKQKTKRQKTKTTSILKYFLLQIVLYVL